MGLQYAVIRKVGPSSCGMGGCLCSLSAKYKHLSKSWKVCVWSITLTPIINTNTNSIIQVHLAPRLLLRGNHSCNLLYHNRNIHRYHIFFYFLLSCCFFNCSLAFLNIATTSVLPITLALCSATVRICIFLA